MARMLQTDASLLPAPSVARGKWAYLLEYGRDSDGRRLQTGKGGFATKAQAQSALQAAVRVLMTDVEVHGLTIVSTSRPGC